MIGMPSLISRRESIVLSKKASPLELDRTPPALGIPSPISLRLFQTEPRSGGPIMLGEGPHRVPCAPHSTAAPGHGPTPTVHPSISSKSHLEWWCFSAPAGQTGTPASIHHLGRSHPNPGTLCYSSGLCASSYTQLPWPQSHLNDLVPGSRRLIVSCPRCSPSRTEGQARGNWRRSGERGRDGQKQQENVPAFRENGSAPRSPASMGEGSEPKSHGTIATVTHTTWFSSCQLNLGRQASHTVELSVLDHGPVIPLFSDEKVEPHHLRSSIWQWLLLSLKALEPDSPGPRHQPHRVQAVWIQASYWPFYTLGCNSGLCAH